LETQAGEDQFDRIEDTGPPTHDSEAEPGPEITGPAPGVAEE
jgi:hypothetical protein